MVRRPVATRPAAPASGTVGPATTAPRPVAPRPIAPRPVGPRPMGGKPPPAGGPGRDFRRARDPNLPPPSAEAIQALAQRERVPARIAKGELEGKMKCRVWRKLHPEEARRFDHVYELMGRHPGLALADAFGVVQSGLSVDEFLARRARVKRKEAVKEARHSVSPVAIDGFVQSLIDEKAELSVVLADRTLLDVLVQVERVSFTFERHGQLEKLGVVVLARRTLWDRVSPGLERDPKLSQKPAAIARQPEKRPVSDPRLFEPYRGKPIELFLRNGLQLKRTLREFGPFDLLLGNDDEQLFVPLHAIVRWQPGAEG